MKTNKFSIISILILIIIFSVCTTYFFYSSNIAPSENTIKDDFLKVTNELSIEKIENQNKKIEANYINQDTSEILLSDFLSATHNTINNDSIEREGYYVNISSDIIKSHDGNEYVNINEISKSLGYVVSINEDNSYSLNRPYAYKRLIIYSEDEITDTYSAKKIIKYGNLQILEFDNEYSTSKAFNLLSNKYNVDIEYFIEPEISQTPEATLDYFERTIQTLDINYSYKSWGATLMGFDKYSTYLSNLDTNEVTVAVLDSGININHEIFKNRISPYCDFKNKTIRSALNDELGHGTHVAGIVADLTTENIKILPIKTLGEVYSYTCTALEYISKLVENEHVNIRAVNCSFTAKTYKDGAEKNLIQKLHKLGVLTVASAGNDGTNCSSISPARLESAITVSNLKSDLKLSSSSNFGNLIDFTAPGTIISSASNSSNNSYVYKSGTSMSSPHISAAIAMLASDPTYMHSATSIEELLRKCSVDIGEKGFDTAYGYGYVDISKAIKTNTTELDDPAFKRNYVFNYAIKSIDFCNASDLGTYYLGYNDGVNKYLTFDSHLNIATLAIVSNQLTLFASPSQYCDFKGWYISKENKFEQDKYYSTDSTLNLTELESGTYYIYAVIKQKIVEVIINFEFQDKEDYTGFASYQAQLTLTYRNPETRKIETYNFTSGFLAKDRVCKINTFVGETLEIHIKTQNDSIIFSQTYQNSTRTFRRLREYRTSINIDKISNYGKEYITYLIHI